MSSTRYSGNTIYALPFTPSAFNRRNLHMNNNDNNSINNKLFSPRVNERSPNFIDNVTVVYAAAGLGVIHNLSNNTQLFHDAHIDDVTCITVSNDGTLAATGCMGKNPVVRIWSTNLPVSESKSNIAVIGNGFFSRGVCACEFSHDNKYIIGVGCDDNSMMGIFNIATNEKIIEVSAQHGLPPTIKWLKYCPGMQYTDYISQEHSGLCDVFATAGERHIKLWSFRRPTNDQPASLICRGMTIGKAQVTAAKVYLCCAFSLCEDKSYDFIAGGSNGVIYLWRRGVIVSFCQAIRGRVQCLVIFGDRIYCGGAGGVMKVLDARTLTCFQEYTLIKMSQTINTKVTPNPMKARPKSASAATQRQVVRPVSNGPKPGAGADNRKKEQNMSDIFGGNNGDANNNNNNNTDNEEIGNKLVTGLTVIAGQGRTALQGTYVIATLATGKAVRVDVGNALQANARPSSAGRRPSSSSSNYSNPSKSTLSQTSYVGKDLFYYHSGPVYGLSTESIANSKRLTASVCDDRRLMIWDAEDCSLIARTNTEGICRCCHFDKTSCFIAVGSTNGSIAIYFLSDSFVSSDDNYLRLDQVGFRKDMKGIECTVIKFSPSNKMIAVGCRDDSIYLYNVEFAVTSSGQGRNMKSSATCVIRAMHRLKGHSSTISHIDWSADSQLLQSTSNAYELLVWDVANGRMFNNSNMNPADIKWKTRHCLLGFNVMGIWRPYSDGTDINSVDVSLEKGIVATGNDQGGLINLFNYPCVIKAAPCRTAGGHSSHVMNVRFLPSADLLISVGGNDSTVMVWDVVKDETEEFK
eukprot:gene12826-17196_t